MDLYKYIVFGLLVFTPMVNASENCGSLSHLDWILGDWRAQLPKRIYQESWRKVSSNTYDGYSRVTSATDKNAGYESLRLVSMSGEVFYLAKVPQNELPIAFKLVSCSTNSLHFQNTKHDFPQSIKYFLNGENKLSVSVEGKDSKGFELHFQRVDKPD